MASNYDPTDFVDDDFQARAATTTTGAAQRAPTREEVDSRVGETQQKLAELKRQQEELERERAALEETRRRQLEFQNGRQEMIHNLTRGLGLLEAAEFTARRDAEQMAKTVGDFRDALSKVEAVHEDTWTKDNFNVELTRALTSIENARMEWNTARLKFPVLAGQNQKASEADDASNAPQATALGQLRFGELCKLGLAFTWPLTVVAIIALGALFVVLFRR
jgi:chromosome segregation ATPase